MALISSGIDRIRVFELPGGFWKNGKAVAVPRVASVEWRSCWADKFYQVYINGQYAGVTLDTEQRQMVVQIPFCDTVVQIEIFAVEPAEGHTDFSSEVDEGGGRGGRVEISFLRGQNLPVGSAAQVYFNGGSGEIDYGNPINHSPVRIWPARQDKSGLGMSRFGLGDFGYDSAAAVGFGKGNFGRGQFGLDADTIKWVSRFLEKGVYKFAVKVADEAGNESIGDETGEVMVSPAPRPAVDVDVFSFNKQTNELVLSVL
jgi:hypothetical protein